MRRNLKSLVPRGSIPLVLGCILVAPIFYNRTALFDNALGFVVVGVGISLIFIGLGRLRSKQPTEYTNAVSSASQSGNAFPADLGRSKTSAPSALSHFFALLGHASVILTVLGFGYMIFLAPTGSTSGVGAGFGVLLAASFYGLAALARS